MSDDSFRESEVGKLVRGILVIIAAALMILPAYFNYEIGPVKFGFDAPAAMSISLTLFAVGIVLFIVAVGPDKFKPKSSNQ